MNLKELKEILISQLNRSGWSISYNQKEDKLTVISSVKKGAHISLKPLLAKFERVGQAAIDEAVRYVEVTLLAMEKEISLHGMEKNIFPVIRSTSFPLQSNEGTDLIYDEHTAETRIFYAADFGEYYTLIDQELADKSGLTKSTIKETALFNLRSLPYEMKEDTVAGNTFYFVSAKDGYDASRILDMSIVDKIMQNAKGEVACAVPHADVCLYADITNDTGYDVLGQMVFQFFTQGKIPITALSFFIKNGELEPTFILAGRKPKQ